MKRAKKHLNNAPSKRPSENYFPTAKDLLEQAFRASVKVSVSRRGIPPIKVIKILNALKIETFGEFLYAKLHELAKQFPRIDSMNPFYLDLLALLANLDRLKQNLSKVNSSGRIIKRLRFMYSKEVYSAGSIGAANAALKSFQGRASSVMKKLERPLSELKVDSKKLIELPSIDFSAPTLVLAGYPNVGKTTILKRLTGASAKIAPYPFTTKQINSGFFKLKYQRIQVLDTPGLLEHLKRNEIEKKAIAALRHLANVIVFIFDATTHSGYSLEEQFTLFSHVKKEFEGKKIIVVVNKAELAGQDEIKKVGEKAGVVILEGADEAHKGNLMRALSTEMAQFLKEA